MRITTIYGSPTPPGKLARGLDLLEHSLIEAAPQASITRLAPSPTDQFVVRTWSDADGAAVDDADIIVFSSPVFRASMTGTLKLLFDMLPVDSLRSKPVGILTVGAAAQHYLSAERHLRDVLSWFGALTAPNSLYFVESVFSSADADPQTILDLDEFAQQLIELRRATGQLRFGPEPLTLRFQRLTGSRPATARRTP